mmetsp:Transcript_127003/g.359452  ORF Transcript_127003/g.359452 Transcript_127003/m.359452 type:complete len:214 (+) Transcript_127003:83-724(+)
MPTCGTISIPTPTVPQVLRSRTRNANRNSKSLAMRWTGRGPTLLSLTLGSHLGRKPTANGSPRKALPGTTVPRKVPIRFWPVCTAVVAIVTTSASIAPTRKESRWAPCGGQAAFPTSTAFAPVPRTTPLLVSNARAATVTTLTSNASNSWASLSDTPTATRRDGCPMNRAMWAFPPAATPWASAATVASVTTRSCATATRPSRMMLPAAQHVD